MSFLATVSTNTMILLAIYPLQVVKNRLQLMEQLIRLGILDRRYEGVLDCIKRIVNQQGYLALYKGFWVHLLVHFASNMLRSCMAFLLKGRLYADRQRDGYFKCVAISFFKSMLIGSAPLVATYTINMAQTISINDIKKQYKSPIQIQNRIRTQRGIKGIFTGIGLSLLGMGLYRVLYIAFQQSLRQFLQKIIKNQTLRNFVTGNLIGIGTSICCYPFQLIRQRMIMACPVSQKYESVSECIQQISGQNNKKISNFWSGIGVSVAKACLASACTYGLMIYIQRLK